MKWARSFSNQRGTSTLEFIVVLQVLLLIFLGGVELSRAWLTVNIVTTAVREGARAGSVAPAASVSSIGFTRVNDVLASANLTATTPPTVNCDPSPCVLGSKVIAQATVTFDTVLPLFLPFLSALEITETATMRYESGGGA